MGVEQAIGELEYSIGAKRVFSDPIEKDGATIILAAKVGGGGGGGGGERAGGEGQAGSGLGFGLAAKPAGAFVIRDGRVSWRPAIDVNRVILGGQIVAITGLLVLRTIARVRALRFLPRRGLLGRRLRFA